MLVKWIHHLSIAETTLLTSYLIFTLTCIAFDYNHFTQLLVFYTYTQRA